MQSVLTLNGAGHDALDEEAAEYQVDDEQRQDGGQHAGIDHLEAFRKLVETAVVAAIPTGSRIDLLTIEYETIEFFPFLLASMEFKIAEDYYQGDDVFK